MLCKSLPALNLLQTTSLTTSSVSLEFPILAAAVVYLKGTLEAAFLEATFLGATFGQGPSKGGGTPPCDEVCCDGVCDRACDRACDGVCSEGLE